MKSEQVQYLHLMQFILNYENPYNTQIKSTYYVPILGCAIKDLCSAATSYSFGYKE